MNILAFTTSTDDGSVALARTGQATAMSRWTRQGQGSEILVYKIKLLLGRAKITPRHIDLIAVDKGPGSFTGCRIAVNVAKTLAMTLGKPLVACSSLDIMAQGALTKLGASFKGRIFCLLDAHKSLFYVRWYECGDAKILSKAAQIQALSLDAIGALIESSIKNSVEVRLVGDGISALKKTGADRVPKLKDTPQARTLAERARHAPTIDWRSLEPSYIRAPDAVEKWRAAERNL